MVKTVFLTMSELLTLNKLHNIRVMMNCTFPFSTEYFCLYREFKVGNLVPIHITPGDAGADLFILTHVVVERQFWSSDQVNNRCNWLYPPKRHTERSTIDTGVERYSTGYEQNGGHFEKYKRWGQGNSSLPNGRIYEGVQDYPLMMRGGSAAQSCTLQMLDAAFGIKHNGDEANYLDEVRGYMLQEHRDLYDYIKTKSRIREYVERSFKESVKESYNECIRAIEGFRRHHITTAHEYITQPAQRPDRNNCVECIRDTGT